MQNQKTLKVLSLLLFFFTLTGFFGGNQSFEEAIEKERKTSVTYVPKVKEGLPYFLSETLTPTWDKKKGLSVPDFELVDQDGKKIGKNIFKDKISVVAFIFTSCAGFCPLLVSKLQMIEDKVRPNKNYQFIVISVDPEVDTPQQLKAYAKSRNINEKRWRFLTGSKKTIYELSGSTFASEIRKIDAQNMRKFAHTEHFYVIDQNLHLRDIINGTRKDMLGQSVATFKSLNNVY